MTEQLFLNASNAVMNLNKEPTNEEKLQLYGLYKQAKFGDNNTSQPSFIDFKNKAKWSAWESCKGKSKGDAMIEYIKLVSKMIEKYG